MKTKVAKTIEGPTPIVIVGGYHNGQLIKITDDYSGFDVRIGDEKIGMGCDGFASVLSPQEFLDWYKEAENEMGEDPLSWDTDAILIPGFSGDIEVGVEFRDGTYAEDFNLGDYLQHQFDGYPDIFIKLPEGSRYEKITDENFMTVIRERKLGDLLDEEN